MFVNSQNITIYIAGNFRMVYNFEIFKGNIKSSKIKLKRLTHLHATLYAVTQEL